MLAANPIPYKGQLPVSCLFKQQEHRQKQPGTGQWYSVGESVLRLFPRREWCVEFVERPGSMVVVVERLRDMVLVPRKAEVASAPDRASANIVTQGCQNHP